jgi:hypothetical protein
MATKKKDKKGKKYESSDDEDIEIDKRHKSQQIDIKNYESKYPKYDRSQYMQPPPQPEPEYEEPQLCEKHNCAGCTHTSKDFKKIREVEDRLIQDFHIWINQTINGNLTKIDDQAIKASNWFKISFETLALMK